MRGGNRSLQSSSLSSLKAPDDLVDARDFRAAGPCLFFGGGGLALLLIFIVEAGCEFFELLVKEGAAAVELLQCFVVEVDFAHFLMCLNDDTSAYFGVFFIKAGKLARLLGILKRSSIAGELWHANGHCAWEL